MSRKREPFERKREGIRINTETRRSTEGHGDSGQESGEITRPHARPRIPPDRSVVPVQIPRLGVPPCRLRVSVLTSSRRALLAILIEHPILARLTPIFPGEAIEVPDHLAVAQGHQAAEALGAPHAGAAGVDEAEIALLQLED